MSSYGIVEVSHSEDVETPLAADHLSLKGTPHLRSINKRDFERWLAEIYPRRHSLVNQLSYSESIILESLKSALNRLIDSDLYQEYYDLVRDKFAERNEEYYPGTVGALLVGCYRYRASELGTCHPSCVGMVQLPPGQSDPCHCAVVHAYWIDHQYHFNVVYYGGTSQAIVYFEQFHGLTPGEIETLRQKGVGQVKLYEYGKRDASWSGDRVRAVTPDFITLDSVPRRNVRLMVECDNSNGVPAQYWILFIIVLILVVVVTAVITYLITKSKYQQ